MKFGENLKQIRKSKKISQEELAEKLGVSRQSISKWEMGENYPSMQNIMCLCKIFKCKINELVHEDFKDINFLDEDIKMSVVKFKKEKQNKMKKISKAIYILARICKIVSLIGIVVLSIFMLCAPFLIKNISVQDDSLTYKGYDIRIHKASDNKSFSFNMEYKNENIAEIENEVIIEEMKNVFENNSITKIMVCSEIGFSFMLLTIIFAYISFKILEKLFINIHNGETPFILENVKNIKKIALLMIITKFLPSFGIISLNILSNGNAEFGFELFDIIEIFFLFSMAYIFEYGYELQIDSNSTIYGITEE